MAEASNYKDTMNLPQTDFPMRGNLAAKEPQRLEKWEQMQLYQRVLEKNKDGEPFILHDGPPYANGPIHIGHAFNKILKDFVVKSHAQRGYFTPYIPGWDCHGQPIEHEVEKKLGTKKMHSMPQDEVRKLCREWAERFIDVQREGFKRLGVNADWEHPYLTFQPNFESANVEVFKKLYLDGAVYRGRKPIHWCKHCHTALAEAEIEYSDESSPSIYVRFKLKEVPAVFEQAGVDPTSAYVLIWTTTPWTLPANVAVCFGPDIDYCFVEHEGAYYLFAHELLETVAEELGWDSYSVVCDTEQDLKPVLMKGDRFEDISYTCPIMTQRTGRIVWGEHVTLDSGTGAVHTAPGHGVEDYLTGQQFGLETLMPVDDDGRFMESVPHFAGMETDEANPHIITWLDEQGLLVGQKTIVHSYPHCWRCHEPVIFRATDQWFVSMEDTGLRKAALNQIENKVNWIPAWGANRIGAMVADRPDWCISRQRSWGVPIPVFKCASCGETVANEATFDAVIDLFNSEGADAWFTKDPAEYLPDGTCCAACGSTQLLPEKDILDVWWESGVSHVGVLKHRAEADNLRWPADMYLEGSDQHRGWFQSSLLLGTAAYGRAPYDNVMCCGFTVDENGEKMSKSKGNGIDPAEVTGKYGADVLRLWVASTDYSVDVSIGDTILQRTSDAYRRFRNTFRFLLGSLSDFDDIRDTVSLKDMPPIDVWALLRLSQILKAVEKGYDEYHYHQVFRALYEYVINDLSAVYMDVAKDRLYSEAPDSISRRSAQTVLFDILEVLVRVLCPILSFTCDEVWEHYPPALRLRANRPESVQLAGWPAVSDFLPAELDEDKAQKLMAGFEVLLLVRDAVTKALEEARVAKVIGKSQEAALKITASPKDAQVINSFAQADLQELFIVAEVSVQESVDVSDGEPRVEVAATKLERCPRCWNHRSLGADTTYPDVCERCAEVLKQHSSSFAASNEEAKDTQSKPADKNGNKA